MKLFIKSIGLVTALAISTACSKQESPNHLDTATVQVEQKRIKAHLEFLADDLLEGRDTGSRGYDIAAHYVATEFKKMGLLPAGDNGSYLQTVPLRKAHLKANSAVLNVYHGNETTALNYPQEFIASKNLNATASQVKAEAVFVGYGVVAEHINYNDYQGLDVEGKIVVTLQGRPESWPSEEGAHLASSRQKLKYAAERGAVGFVTIHTPKREKVRTYVTSLNYLRVPAMRWLDDSDQPYGTYPQIKGSAYINSDAAKSLFTQAPVSLEQIFELDIKNQAIQGFELNTEIELASESRHEQVTSSNVLAILPGSDPKLKDEYVVYTAHLDHIGFSQDVTKKDRINNGALDNASGVALLLETARVLANSEAPRRSILFTVVTGEEKGLLGANYFTNNPTVPMSAMVANVNLDMPVLLYDFADIIAFGANHSSMGSVVEQSAAPFGIKLSPDPMPERAIFTRSDHYNFVKKGVPSVFLMTGFTSKTEGENGGKVWGDFFANHYHKPSDSLDLPLNYEAAELFAKINIAIGKTVANQEQRPYWLEDSFFGKTFSSK